MALAQEIDGSRRRLLMALPPRKAATHPGPWKANAGAMLGDRCGVCLAFGEQRNMAFLPHIKTETVLRYGYVLPMLNLISDQIPVAEDRQ